MRAGQCPNANISLALVLPERHPYHFAIVAYNLSSYSDTIPHRDVTVSVYIQDQDEKNVEMPTSPNEDGTS